MALELEPFKFEFRQEIDGLRAVAVILVVVSHTHLEFFNYGGNGVYVFFVISGYLITSVILRDITRQKFTIRGFYERRLKRIMPNLLLCSFTNFIIVMLLK